MSEESATLPADEKELADYMAWVRREYGVPEGEIVVYGMGGHPVAWSRRLTSRRQQPAP